MAMIICPECKKDISDKSEVCVNCGYPIAKMQNGVVIEETDSLEKKKLNKKLLGGIVAAISVAGIILTVIIILIINMNNPVNKYISYIEKGNFDSAKQIYSDEIDNSEDKKEELSTKIKSKLNDIVEAFQNQEKDYDDARNEILVYDNIELVKYDVSGSLSKIRQEYETRLKKEVDDIKASYFEGKLEYEGVINKLNKIKEAGLISVYISDAEKLIKTDKDSYEAYEAGENYYKNKEYEKALEEYVKVDSNNSKYEDAKTKIAEVKNTYEQQVISEVKALESSNIGEALSKVNKAIRLIGETQKLSDLKKDYTKRIEDEKARKEAERIENLKNNQAIVVLGTSVDGPGFLNGNDVYVTVKNQSSKYVKEYTVCMLIFDKNGFPLVPQYNSNNIEYGRDVKTLAPGEVYGQNSYWTVFCAEKMYVKACVISAEYQDGSSWTNEYYSYWLAQNRDKY